MNQKELRELRKHFSADDDLLVLNRVITAFVDAEKQVRCTTNRAYHDIPTEEAVCYWNTLKRSLSGTLGKTLLEYPFPKEAYAEGQPQHLLYQALQSRLDNENDIALLLQQITEKMQYVSTYAVLIGHCTYTVFRKTRNDEEDPYNTTEYHFLVAAICPVEVRIDGLIYNETDNAITRKEEYDRIVAEVPTDGFLFPVFTDRSADVNSVLYHAKKAKDINLSLIEDVLGCTFTSTADEEKEQFQSILQSIAGEELTYDTITEINSRIQSVAEEFQPEEAVPVIDDILMRDILLESGICAETAEEVQAFYRDTVQNHPCAACNLAEKKTVITAPGLQIQIKNDAVKKVHTQNIDGRRYLMIDLDDPQIQVNGLTAAIPEVHAAPAATEESEDAAPF